MVESRRTRASDIHTRSQAYRFKTLKNLDLTSTVFLLFCHSFLPCYCSMLMFYVIGYVAVKSYCFVLLVMLLLKVTVLYFLLNSIS